MSMPVKIAAQAPQTQRPTYVGGGTDLMPLLKNHVRDDKELVFLNGVEELNGIWEEAGWITIGAGATPLPPPPGPPPAASPAAFQSFGETSRHAE